MRQSEYYQDTSADEKSISTTTFLEIPIENHSKIVKHISFKYGLTKPGRMCTHFSVNNEFADNFLRSSQHTNNW